MEQRGAQSWDEVFRAVGIAAALGFLTYVVDFLIRPFGSSVDLQWFLPILTSYVAGAGFVVVGRRELRKAKRIQLNPVETAASVTPGRTELEGTGVADEHVLDRPFSDGTCLCASVSIEQYTSGRGLDWVTVLQTTVARPFYLDDGTGKVRIEPDSDARVSVSDARERSYVVGRRETPPAEIQEFIEGYPVDDADRSSDEQAEASGHDGGAAATSGGLERVRRTEFGQEPPLKTLQKLRYTERVIPAGTDLYVKGCAKSRDDTSDSADSQLTVTGFDSDREFMISDSGSEAKTVHEITARGREKFLTGVAFVATGLVFYLVLSL